MRLLVHPDSSAGPVRVLSASAGYGTDGALELGWRLEGDPGQLRLPGAAAPTRATNLWEHTCFEAFIADPHSTGYVELNFSSSGAWAVYGFRGYRDGGTPLPLRHDPVASWRHEADALILDARFRMDGLPGPPGPRPRIALRLAMAAVIEDAQGVLSWWALRHPAGKPDFHHADGFVLDVA